MICQEGHIETQCKPLCCTKKHDTEGSMDEVLWKDKLEEKTQASYRLSKHLGIKSTANLESRWQLSFHSEKSLVFLESEMKNAIEFYFHI